MEKSYAKSLKTWSKKWGDLIEKGKRNSFVISRTTNDAIQFARYRLINTAIYNDSKHGVSFTSLYQSVGDILKISFHSHTSPTQQKKKKRLLTVRD